MKVLYNWLKEFADITLAPAALRDGLSLAGTAIEGLEETAAGPMLDAELTINRPDCLGHYGMAREAAALERKPLRPIDTTLVEVTDKTSEATRVEIECPELCGRYTARIVRGVKVGPSPAWMKQRLEALGQTSINNIVDATNYVMLELGQPMHAFDLDRLAERRIVVRQSRPGERLKTLDGVERALPNGTCLIADAARGVAIAGIMGGVDSEITSQTRTVLLESAWFDAIAIRRTSKALNLRTEASLRFERGADPEMAEIASRRCAAIITEIAGGEVLEDVVEVYPGPREAPTLRLSRQELLRVMGADVPDAEIEAILGSLGFAPKRSGSGASAAWECKRPSWREEVSREIDLVEEVARFHGLDKFPARLPVSKRPAARLPHAELEDRLRERLMGLGYQEIVSIPLVDEEEDALFRPEGTHPARIGNPLAADASLMRSNGLVSMAHALAWNLNRGQQDLRLFEIGRAYAVKNNAPVETRIVTVGATGLARKKSVAESARPYGFADLKGDLEQIGELAGGLTWTASALPWQNPIAAGQFAAKPAQDSLGAAGQLARRIAEWFKLRQDAFLAEMSLDAYYACCRTAQAARRYRPISRFPAVERDFSLTLDDGTAFSAVEKTIGSLGIAEIASIEALDLFRGKNVAAGKFSLLVRVTLQSQTGTLTEAQVNEYSAKIVAALEGQLGASLRS